MCIDRRLFAAHTQHTTALALKLHTTLVSLALIASKHVVSDVLYGIDRKRARTSLPVLIIFPSLNTAVPCCAHSLAAARASR